MKKVLSMALVAASAAALTSCGKLGALSADNFTVTPTPLEGVAGKVPTTINGTFPEKYMKKKATVTVTPVLKYEGGEAVGQSATFQGEKVNGNGTEINYKMGGNYTMKSSFDYVPAMMKSDLYLRFDATVGSKSVNVPEVKVGYGVISTSDLLGRCLASTNGATAADAYQRIIDKKYESQIKFLINQANLRKSELQSTSVQDFIAMIKQINDDQEKLAMKNIQVNAYASPDGRYGWNEQLAEKRQNVTEDYLKKEMNKLGTKAYDVNTKYTAEDWDGFKELVQASNIQDKDVILRVLSMYQDPEEREAQIHNLGAVFTELAEGILPELRRSRLIINYQVIGRSDEQIMSQFKSDAKQLSVEELLYAANKLAKDDATREAILTKTTQLYPNDYRAFNNMAQVAYAKGDLNSVSNFLAQAKNKGAEINGIVTKGTGAAEVATNEALVALKQGNAAQAENLLGKGAGSDAYNAVLGNLNIAKGNYGAAAQALAGVNSNSAALAQILNKDYAAAAKTLAAVKNGDGVTSYLGAILAARQNDAAGVASNLKAAVAKDASLAQRALNDLEFAAFESTVKSLF